jgi:glycosyltransferase involved in cell wall biosynthesis
MEEINMSPTVSVLTSCYNASRYLAEAIESILEQTFKDFEFILIDDGSADNTVEIIRQYEKKDKRIVRIEKAHTGLTDSLNLGLGMARGTWIARLDADDLALKNRLEEQVNYVLNNKDIVLLGTGCIVIDENGVEIRRKTYPSSNANLLKCIFNGGSPFPHSSVLFRRDEVQRMGGYRPRFNMVEDVDLWLRLSSEGQIASLKMPLIKLRKHTASISSGQTKSLGLAYALLLSYNFTKQNHPNPIEQDEMHYQEFIKWLESRLKQLGLFDERRILLEIEKRRDSRPGIRKNLEILDLLISHHGFHLIKKRFFGSDLIPQLTNEWIKMH